MIEFLVIQRVEEETKPRAASSSRTPPKKNRLRGKSSPLATAVGDDGKRIPLEIKKGDRILFGKYSVRK
jgi:chaperonin GroES